ncbi:hypothetical protein BDZ89DRAFT_963015, partial [Hymenopellis radicata]
MSKFFVFAFLSVLMRISLVMHPDYKTKYFEEHGWEPAWVTTAVKMARDVWTTYYKPTITPKKDAPATKK